MKNKASKALLYVLLVVLIGAVGWFAFRGPYQFHGTVIKPPLPLTDFELQNGNAETFQLSDAKGKIVLLFFGYTSCPDVCPITLATFKQVQERLGDDAEHVNFVMITADPERDDPEKVAAYVERFHPEFVGLSGARPDLEAVWQQFAVYVEKQNSDSAAGYLVSHTSSVFVLDPQGNLVMTFPYGTSALDMTRDIQELMRQARHN